jgi:hypothetical protein
MMARFRDVTSLEVLIPRDGVPGCACLLDWRHGFRAALDVVRLGLGGDRGHRAVRSAK